MTVHLRIHTEAQGMLAGQYPESFQYPGGEWNLRNIPEIPSDQGAVTLIADVRGADPNDLVKAALWADVADSANFWHAGRVDFSFVLMMPYLPAARADKRDTDNSPVGANIYARFIRGIAADRVITIDPHSSYMPRLFRNLRVASPVGLVRNALEGFAPAFDAVICPDKGAVDRADAVAIMMGVPVYTCDKQRDLETGKILGLKVPPLDPKRRYLVVDDICDGGGTFALLADKIGLPREQLGLWVTHGIFSGRADELRKSYGWIGTTDSHPGHNRVGVATTIVPCFMTMYNQMSGVKK
ncbi:phosphoribosyl pyrophosphate transferase [Mycobacterium phage Myrna]|uniref:ribose-phosphate diphosphokinase n=1 Tax=Mycobacterium phage Myrna TaxID=546805 RepID=B5LJN1_9CAUD|nr:ribose-phosphate pyrophosphokinase [Mycobacterium phage Myrna]ACH62228.1 phosphoribosyl pyrophosphate transferase [Mycobacterium phage Myrna]